MDRVWNGGESDRQNINIKMKQEIKILGLDISKRDCGERKWEEKLCEIKCQVQNQGKKDTVTDQA